MQRSGRTMTMCANCATFECPHWPDGKRAREAIGVPSNRITAILKDERGITGDTASRLRTFFKTSAEFWVNPQMT